MHPSARCLYLLLSAAAVATPTSAQDLQSVVDQFYPVQQLPVDSAEERRSCFGVVQDTGGTAQVVAAGYTNGSRAMVRILSRDTPTSFVVAADTPASLRMLGDRCEIALDDLDGDQADEIVVTLSRGGGNETWVFRWNGATLDNKTPMRPDAEGASTSALVNAMILDLDHDGLRQLYINESTRDLSEPQTDPNLIYPYSAAGFGAGRGVVAAARFVVVQSPDSTWTTFRSTVNRPGPYTLRIVNGAPGGLGRVSSLAIELNDQVVLSAGQVTSAVEFLTVPLPVTLTDLNRLDLDMAGPLGSFVTLVIDYPPLP